MGPLNHNWVWGNGALIAILLLSLCSCHDPEDPVIDYDAPIIEVTSPVRNSVYKNGDTLFISAIFYDENELRRGSLHLHDLLLIENDTVFNWAFELNGSEAKIDTFCLLTREDETNYKLYFDITDKAENYNETIRYLFLVQ